ncbi:MAG: hypothetical protein AMXMBFR13_32340 [Phycisphaerae bacterium]|jgi:hypothetical protein
MVGLVRMWKWMTLAAGGAMLFGGGCLVDDFWVNKWSELVNRAIFGVINNALTAANLQTI